MKTMKRIFSAVLLLCLVMSLSVNAFATKGPKTYTVRIYSGNNGTGSCTVSVSSDEKDPRRTVTLTDTSVGFGGSTITLNDEKYYIKGIRETGKDELAAVSFIVTEDKDYVVAYGMRGDAVAYTVNYVDADGNELAPTITGYGSAGDKPIVGFFPIDGYQPQAYNLTMTLSEDASANVFTFVYTPVTEETPSTEEEPAETPTEPAEADTPEAAPADEAEAPAADTEAPADDVADEGEVADEGDVAAANTEPAEAAELSEGEIPLAEPAEPEEIIDMDVPLANAPTPGNNADAGAALGNDAGTRSNTAAIVGGTVGAAAVIAIALWLVLTKRKQKA